MKKVRNIVLLVVLILEGWFIGWHVWYDHEWRHIAVEGTPVVPITVVGRELLPWAAEITVPIVVPPFGVIQNWQYTTTHLDSDGSAWIVPPLGTEPNWHSETIFGEVGSAPYTLSLGLPVELLWTVTLSRVESAGGETQVYDFSNISDSDAGVSDLTPSGALPADSVEIDRAGNYKLHIVGKFTKTESKSAPAFFVYTAYFTLAGV